MTTQMTELVEQVLSELETGESEYESSQMSYFYVDAYRAMPDGSFQSLQATGPWSTTPSEADKVMTGMCVKWANNNPSWNVAVRCFRWTGSRWVKCDSANVMPCRNIS
jgi:hypothetical protein